MLKGEKQKLNIYVVSILIGLVLIIFLSRILFLAFFPPQKLIKFTKNQYNRVITLSKKRGNIFDLKGNPLAVTVSLHSLYADPKLIEQKDKKKLSQKISKILNLKYSEVFNKINSKRRFTWLKRKIKDSEYKKLEKIILETRGLNTIKEPLRSYPNKTLASHVIGFVNVDSKGLSGVELFYDKYLKGAKNKHKVKYKRDAKGRIIYDNRKIFEIAESANSLYLTIDASLQYQIESILRESQEYLQAKSITTIVMDPYSGEIVTLANTPNYDPNKAGRYSYNQRKNRAITDVYEPGSTFKILTAAIALKEKLLTPNTKIWCEKGNFKVNGRVIKEAEGHHFEWLRVKDIIAKSSNIGTAKLSFLIGFDRFLQGIDIFGIGRRTGIDLPGEVKGLLRRTYNKVMLATMSFGQGIAVTPIQILQAYAIIANGGYEVIPHVVKKVTSNKKDIFVTPSTMSQTQIISQQTSKELRDMLRLVVSKGTGVGTNIKGFKVAGKTGTAQKPDIKHGGYYKNKYILSFAGFFPVEKPRYVIIVVVDDPKKGIYASTVAVPIFRRVSNVLIQNMGIDIKKIKISKKLSSFRKKTRFKIQKQAKKLEQVPNFNGLTLREVIKNLNGSWKDIFIKGSGVVYKQVPEAKTKYKKGLVLHLYLK